jgi:hypothetical protein
MTAPFNISGVLIVMLLGSTLGAGVVTPRKGAPKQVVAAPVQPQVQTPPPPPPTPEQMPASPPQVAMTRGLLTIVADNSTMGEILNAVRKVTGAALEIPSAANSERVAAHLGPGTPRDVLHDLFTGSKFDYILVGNPENQDAVQRIILTARAGSTTPGGTAVAGNGAPNQPGQAPPDGGDAEDQPDNSAEEEPPIPVPEPASPEQPPVSQQEETVSPQDQQQITMPNQVDINQQQQQQQQPQQQQQQQQPQQQQPQQQQQQGPKTPEQLLQELQRMQQRQNPGTEPK